MSKVLADRDLIVEFLRALRGVTLNVSRTEDGEAFYLRVTQEELDTIHAILRKAEGKVTGERKKAVKEGNV